MPPPAVRPLVIGIDPDLSLKALVKQATARSQLYDSEDGITDPGDTSSEETGVPVQPKLPVLENQTEIGKCGVPTVWNQCSFIHTTAAVNRDTKRKNKKRALKRQASRRDLKDAQRLVRQKAAMSTTIATDFPLNSIPVSKDMLTGMRGSSSNDSYPRTLEEVKAKGYRIVQWDGM